MGDGFETGKAGGAVLLAQLRLVEALPQTEAWAKLMSVNDKKNIRILIEYNEEMVFCYQNCSDLLWEKIVVVIEENFDFWDH